MKSKVKVATRVPKGEANREVELHPHFLGGRLLLKQRRKESSSATPPDMWIVTGYSAKGERFHRPWPTQAEADRDVEAARKRKCKDVQVTKRV